MIEIIVGMLLGMCLVGWTYWFWFIKPQTRKEHLLGDYINQNEEPYKSIINKVKGVQ